MSSQVGAPTKVRALPNGMVTIDTSRLLLRAAEVTDLDGLHECFSDGIAMKYWSTLPHEDKDATMKWIAKMIGSPRNGRSDFVIELKTETSRPCVGKVGVWGDNEIGFMIARKYWRQGLASEAATAVLDHFFGLHVPNPAVVDILTSIFGNREQWPVDIVADVDPRNEASLRALTKLGFEIYETKTKTLEIGGQWVDSVYLRLRKDAWLKARQAGTL